MDFRIAEFNDAAKWMAGHLDELGRQSADPLLLQEWKRHAETVAAEVGGLASDLGLNAREKELVQLMGTVHAISELVPPEKLAAESTREERGFELLDASGCLSGLSLDEKPLIEAVVLYHAKPTLPGFLTPRALFFCQLVRDANQLDEWVLALAALANYPVCGELKRDAVTDLLSGRPPASPPRFYREDAAVAELGRVFCFHFAVTLRRVLGRELIQRTCAELTQEPAIAIIVEHLCTYVRNRIAADSVTPRRPA